MEEKKFEFDEWDFIEQYYPDYYHADEVAENDDICKVLENDYDPEDAEDNNFLQQLIAMPKAKLQRMYNESQRDLLERAFQNYLDTTYPNQKGDIEIWREHLEKVNEELTPFGIVIDVEYSQKDNGYYINRADIPFVVFVEDNISEEELCEEISIFGINQIESTINKPEDVGRFFKWLVECKKLCFHPDDSFFDYINYDTKERSFTDGEASALDDVMERCFDVCDGAGKDIYQIAMDERTL